jgi:DNA replication protein DnaC
MAVYGITDDDFLTRARARMQRMGIDIDPAAGPVDDTPTPDEPGHPEYHRRMRARLATERLDAVTPYVFRTATATEPAVTAWADRVLADMRAARSGRDQRTAGTLLITGDMGVGKTWQAYGALRRIAEAGPYRFQAVTVTAPAMYELMRPNGSERGPAYETGRLERVQLLLIDDIGVERLTEFTEEAAYRVFNSRYAEMLPTIVTSNLPVRDGNPGRPDLVKQLGERIVSRLAQTATHVPMVGADRRYG